MSSKVTGTDASGLGLSEQDLERIAAFASTPKYARDPEMLLPEGAADGLAEDEE